MKTLPLHKLPAFRFKPIAAVSLSFIALVIFIYNVLPVHQDWHPGYDGITVGVDWKGAYNPAIHEIFAGRTPYKYDVYNPPWALYLLSPLAALDPALASTIMFVATIMSFAYVAKKIGGRWGTALLIAFSPPVLAAAFLGNLDWVVALGLLMPPTLGLFFVLFKPQTGLAVALFWTYKVWKEKGFREMVKMWIPVILAFGISFIAYGLYPLRAISRFQNVSWNVSLWPFSIPFGLALLYLSIRQVRKDWAVSASPLLATYVTKGNWSMFYLGLASSPRLLWVALLLIWLYQIYFNTIFPLRQLYNLVQAALN